MDWTQLALLQILCAPVEPSLSAEPADERGLVRVTGHFYVAKSTLLAMVERGWLDIQHGGGLVPLNDGGVALVKHCSTLAARSRGGAGEGERDDTDAKRINE
jgi:hypothetical protein